MRGSVGIGGYIAAMINKHRVNKYIRQISKDNLAKQGITRYKPSNIEAFINDTESIQSMIFSGGLNSIRTRAISRAVQCANKLGYSIVVLHCANKELENMLTTYRGKSNVCTINSTNPVYDPFWGLNNAEISRLVISSITKGYEINPVGKYYIDGISEMIRAKGKQPYLNMYLTCPHMTLIDKVNDAEAKGHICSNVARAIISQFMQGEIERGNIENYFLLLSNQIDNILAKKPSQNTTTNVEIATQRKQIITFDVQSATNSLLINLISSEVEFLLAKGKKVMLVADNIQFSSSEVLQSLMKKAGSNCSIVLASDDVFASFGGEEKAFFSFAGKCSHIILSKHSSAYSCQKIADVIGHYDKQEITSTFARNSDYGRWSLGSAQTLNVNVKRENIVKPEEINRMKTDDVYVLNKSTGELSFTTVV